MAINRPVTKTIISTTGWGIPITDQVNANTTDIAALKAAPVWYNLPLSNGWTPCAGFVMQYCKVNGFVYTRGSVMNGSNASGVTIGTLPTGFRSPVTIQWATFAYTTFWQVAPLDLQTDGRITVGAGWPTGIGYLPIQVIFSITA